MGRISCSILLALIVFSAGCAQQTQTEKTAETTANVITIRGFAFNPPALTIKAGTTVTWVNEDSAPHIIASDPHPTHTDLPGLVSGELSGGQNYSFIFNETGTFTYHCHVHPSMKGTIIVEG